MNHIIAISEYYDRFGARPDFTTINMNDAISAPFIDACRRAIKRGKPLTAAELAEVEREVYGDLFDDPDVAT